MIVFLDCHSAECHLLIRFDCNSVEFYSTESHSADCHFAERHSADSHFIDYYSDICFCVLFATLLIANSY
jgi:hypothetical protein